MKNFKKKKRPSAREKESAQLLSNGLQLFSLVRFFSPFGNQNKDHLIALDKLMHIFSIQFFFLIMNFDNFRIGFEKLIGSSVFQIRYYHTATICDWPIIHGPWFILNTEY